MKKELPEHPPRAPEGKTFYIQETGNVRVLDIRIRETREIFRRWMGPGFDMEVLDTILSATSGNLISGDPVWLMIVGPAGAGKTEMASSLEGCGAMIVSSISSEGALLSASLREKAKKSTGGILRLIGDRGLIVLKDFTTILSMPERTSRSMILAAFREIYDGRFSRNVGYEGGQTIEWKGHLGIIGCATTAWDTAHSSISKMGDRFVVSRISIRDMDTRIAIAKQAMANVGREAQMRQELKHSVEALFKDMNPGQQAPVIPKEVGDHFLKACNIAVMARTPTDHDYKGKIEYSHDPEAPTRLSKSLSQLVRGGLALGVSITDAFNMAMRCVRDSIPPIRLECLEYLSRHSDKNVAEIANGIQRPWNTVDRAVEALTSARLLTVEYKEGTDEKRGKRRFYNIRHDVDISTLWDRAVARDEKMVASDQ